jgi:hypothetical protein
MTQYHVNRRMTEAEKRERRLLVTREIWLLEHTFETRDAAEKYVAGRNGYEISKQGQLRNQEPVQLSFDFDRQVD